MQKPYPKEGSSSSFDTEPEEVFSCAISKILFYFSLLWFSLLLEENIFTFLRDPLKCGMAADSVRDYNLHSIFNNTAPTGPAPSSLKAIISDMLF
jgi:hypothetical protein